LREKIRVVRAHFDVVAREKKFGAGALPTMMAGRGDLFAAEGFDAQPLAGESAALVELPCGFGRAIDDRNAHACAVTPLSP